MSTTTCLVRGTREKGKEQAARKDDRREREREIRKEKGRLTNMKIQLS